jgi:PAS domain S-box-containing protein
MLGLLPLSPGTPMTLHRAKRILRATILAAPVPFLLVVLFPTQLDVVLDGASYLLFHNVAEFFSIMVSLSVFGVGWYTYDQSEDRHALFLGTAFLATGLVDFMHALSSAAMPAFITANSTNKSSQYWIAARLLDSSALLASAFILPHRPLRWLTKRRLLAAALAVSGTVFTGITFFPSHVPSTFVPGVGLTPFKVASEYLVISLLVLALAAYWRRMERTGDPLLVHYMSAFVIGIFGEAAFASYKVDFGTHNVLGHLYKVAAFYLIYRGAFAAAAEKPYLRLSDANQRLKREVSERQEAEAKVRALNAELEQRVLERTSRLEAAKEAIRKREEEARAHAVQLEAILDCVADGVIVYDREGRTLRSTPAADRILGVPIGERQAPVQERVLGQYEVFSEEGRRLGREELVAVRAAVHGETIRDVIQEVRVVGREPHWLSLNAMPLSLDGARTGAVISFTDLTHRKRAEQELRRTEQALRDVNEQLRDADHRKDVFLGMLSHELRNPLAPIRNSIYVLRHATPGSEQARRAQAVIDRQTQHVTRLVDDLLDVTRIAHGKVELRRSRVDLREVVQRAADDLRPLMDERGLTFCVAVPPAQVWADADPTRLTQVVSNLLHNAAKFTCRGGGVTLSLQVVAGRAQLAVRDTGEGIDAALLPRVFEPFVQGDRTLARSDGGLGLGLALVRAIAELHGGTAHAESAGAGHGAELVVVLPTAEAPVRDVAPAGAHRPSRPRRILVVDDNRDGAESLAQVVEMLGHAAQVAYDGPSALEMASANAPEVILCDIGLPGMNGYQVARALRAAGAGLKLFAVSGYAQPEDVRRAVEAGFDGHLAKPVDVADIERLLD